MDPRFSGYVNSLHRSFRRLMAMKPLKVEQLPSVMPTSGVYLFSERGRHLYAGRSNRLKVRIQLHSRPAGRANSASFAFRLARGATGFTGATYVQEGSRAALMRKPSFRKAFQRAKERIRRMDVRYVEEEHALRQALLEIYASVVLRTPHNDFDTH